MTLLRISPYSVITFLEKPLDKFQPNPTLTQVQIAEWRRLAPNNCGYSSSNSNGGTCHIRLRNFHVKRRFAWRFFGHGSEKSGKFGLLHHLRSSLLLVHHLHVIIVFEHLLQELFLKCNFHKDVFSNFNSNNIVNICFDEPCRSSRIDFPRTNLDMDWFRLKRHAVFPSTAGFLRSGWAAKAFACYFLNLKAQLLPHFCWLQYDY